MAKQKKAKVEQFTPPKPEAQKPTVRKECEVSADGKRVFVRRIES